MREIKGPYGMIKIMPVSKTNEKWEKELYMTLAKISYEIASSETKKRNKHNMLVPIIN